MGLKDVQIWRIMKIMEHGFVRVAAAVPRLKIADCAYNAGQIIEGIKRAAAFGADVVVFPELSLTSYTCGDLFHQKSLLDAAIHQLDRIAGGMNDIAAAGPAGDKAGIVAIVGLPVTCGGRLYNCAAVLQDGALLGVVPKSYIPGYKEYYEERWFSPGLGMHGRYIDIGGFSDVPFGTDLIFRDRRNHNFCFGIEVCEDLWVPAPPSSFLAMRGACVIFNLSASNEAVGKYDYRKGLVTQQSGRCIAGYVYTSSGIDESSTDLVFSGHSIIAENGVVLAESQRFAKDGSLIYTEIDVDRLASDRMQNTCFKEFAAGCPANTASLSSYAVNTVRIIGFDAMTSNTTGSGLGSCSGSSSGSGPDPAPNPGLTLTRSYSPTPFVPAETAMRDERCREIFAIQTAGLAKRLRHTQMKKVVLGISGGLDSTLALLVAARTFDMLGYDRKNIVSVTMPGFGTSGATYTNALDLISSMKTSLKEIDIRDACSIHFRDIGHDPANTDVTFENAQARERTQILMDIANQVSGLVVGTSDLSEIALGWSTYNGDHMSMYAVNCGIPKTLVKYLVRWVADNLADARTRGILHSVLETPITPELIPPDADGRINQKTEDIIGPYELHDFFLYHMVRYGAPPAKIVFLAMNAFKGRYGAEEIKKWLKVFYSRFFTHQFKRSCMPDGPKVGTISLSPRGDWRMPSDAGSALWIDEIDSL